MRTFKRTPNQVDTSLSSYSKSIKYFNQMEWKGIVENKNIYTVDQKSLSDAKNVYVDDQGTLKSRPVLIREPLSKDILPTNSRLVDMLTYGKVKIYISDDHYNSNHNYKITAIGTSTAVLNDITNYHISTVENYIVCFNDQGAKVFDINNQSKGWQDFSNFVEVPIIQRIVGGETSTYENNQFTTRYKKEYIWSNSSQPQLPSDYTASNGIDLVVNAQDGPFEWHLPVSSSRGTLDKTPLMQYMTFRKIKATVDISHIGSSGALEQGKFSAQGNTICISVEDGVLVSFDNGDTFTKEYLPYTQNHFEDWIAGITDDGAYYMRVHADGVHVLNLAKLQNKDDTRWEVIYPWNDSTKTIKGNFTTFNTNLRLKGYQYCAHFVTKDIFAFIVETNVGPVLWFMAPGLAGHSFIDYKKNSTSGNSGYKTPILTDDTIAANKVGTLSCSDLFQRGLGNSFCNQIDNKTSWSGSVESGLRGASLRIIKDHGELLENADKTGEHYQERTVESDYYTIAITMLANDTSSAEYGGPKNPTCFTCLILPGSQCVKYTDGTYEPLNADNRHWKDTFAMGAVFGPTLGTWGGGDEAHSDYAYSIVHDDFGSGKAVEYYPARKSDGSNHWLYTCTPKAIRVNSVQKIDKWTVGKYAGQGYNDMSSYMGSTKMGLWQVKGSVYLENLPDLIDTDTYYMSRYGDTCWYEFTAEFGHPENEIMVFGAFQLTARMTSYTSVTVPFKTYNNDYWIAEAAYKPEYNSSINTDRYSCWLDAPQEIWKDDWSSRKFSETLWTQGNTIFVRCGNEVYTNALNDEDTVQIQFTYGTQNNDKYKKVPQVSYFDSAQLFLGFDNMLSITANTRDDNDQIVFNLPKVNNQKFIENLTNIINISTTEQALFFEDNIIICSRVEDETFGYRYDYYPTKLSTGTRLGDSIINTIEGTYTIFPTKRGLAFMNYQAFMATTDQVLTYMTDPIEDRYDKFYEASETIKLVQMRDRLFVTNGTGDILIYDFSRAQWWFWQLPKGQFNYELPVKKLVTDQLSLYVVSHRLYKFGDYKRQYLDFENIENDIGEDSYLTPVPTKIDWFIVSQPLHLNAPNYYKNLKQLVFQLLGPEQDSNKHTIKVQIKCYRKKADVKEPELIEFTIDELRTFVKRFNYWKLCEVQYALADDSETQIPTQLQLNGIAVKYELGEEVR